MYSTGATNHSITASLRRKKVGERLSWSRNNSERKRTERTSQYLRRERGEEVEPVAWACWRAWKAGTRRQSNTLIIRLVWAIME